MKIQRLLIANRGEIAVRIIRACREVGISPVAVCSDADRDVPHVALADAFVNIGPGPATESYLRIDSIVDAAREMGADAVHPGYGFLSENADFAQACATAGLTFIGPPAGVIRLLGDKIAAKHLAISVGAPVAPGYHGDDQSDAALLKEAQAIGVPVLIKAAAGGGGRGMRVVRDLAQFDALAAEARREAESAFGDGRLLLERYVGRPRHIEVQIFGDTYGNVVHLFERECSIQRRHQKILEESPSPGLTPELRADITDAALRIARAAGYVGAGTVEFLLESSGRPIVGAAELTTEDLSAPGPSQSGHARIRSEGQPVTGTPSRLGEGTGEGLFYFLEVNTRLQVEHPVTELITGLDLVKLQLLVAQGEALPEGLLRSDTALGHAIEARIYAEDPATGFLPSTGTLTQWIPPTGPGVRVDSGVERGSVVSPYYDPMLAKLIAHGSTRDEALARLEQALLAFHVLGVRTNITYLLDIVRHPAFRAGDLFTGFLAEHFAGWRPEKTLPNEVLLVAVAEALTRPAAAKSGSGPGVSRPLGPWQTTEGWRNA